MRLIIFALFLIISLKEINAEPIFKKDFKKLGDINNKNTNIANLNSSIDSLIDDDKLNSYLTIYTGTFVRGLWGPKYITTKCTVWELCFENLEGFHLGTSLTKELYTNNSLSFDFDTALMLADHDTKKNAKNYEVNSGDKFYINFSFIPMIRIKKISNKFPLGIGYGAGFSYVVGKPKIEQPYDTPLLSEVKAELSYPINKLKDSEIVFSLHHRCTFLGLLTPKDGTSFGQHWYSVGFRYKL